MDRPAEKSTMSWMNGWLGNLGSTIRLYKEDLTKLTLTTNIYMWTRSSRFLGIWLDLVGVGHFGEKRNN
jgi:hypothetical protein